MKLSKKAIDEFKEIYFREFGQNITDEEAQVLGSNLISLFKIICRSVPEDTNSDFSGDVIQY
jgi:hypothetical protein